MNGWDLLEAVGNIDAPLIEAAAQDAARPRPQKRTVRIVAAAAVCAAAVIAFVGTTLVRHSIREPASLYGEEGSAVFGTDIADRPVTAASSAAGTVSDTPPATTPAVGNVDPGTEKTGTAPATGDATSRAETASVVPSSAAAVSGPETAGSTAAAKEPSSRAEGSSVVPSSTARPVDENAPEPDGGYSGGAPVPSGYAETAPVVRGTGYTPAEIAALLEREGYAIAQTAASETGCAVGDVRILTDGYCHTSLGAENVADKDYLTLPVCVGDRIVAAVDLFRVDGEVHYSVSAGGSRWDNINRALAYGTVAFVYAGYGELAVTADGTIFEITVDASQAVAGVTDLYQRAASPCTLFSLSRLKTASYVTPGR